MHAEKSQHMSCLELESESEKRSHINQSRETHQITLEPTAANYFSFSSHKHINGNTVTGNTVTVRTHVNLQTPMHLLNQ